MRVFMTGATGFIGSAVVRELIGAGHQVLGMARGDAGAQALLAAGSGVHRGSLEDLDSLRRGAAAADAVIHLGFIHDFSTFADNCAVDQRAIEALGSVLAGSDRPLIVAAGLGGLAAPGQVATEAHDPLPDFPFPRVSEQAALGLLSKGVSAAVMRLPQVHDTTRQGLVTYTIALAKQKGMSAYVGDGQSRWAAVHVSDLARLYRLALEKHEPGAKYHAVAEEGVSLRDIAEAVGRGLQVPAVSIPAEEAAAHFGWMGMLAIYGIPASSVATRQKLGWQPAGPSLLADLEKMDYSAIKG
jgi:nucleoside-diphosphate-sugar epimerase